MQDDSDGASAEERRLEALAGYCILDTEHEAHFNRIVELARNIFGMPISHISLIDRDRQWFKAESGSTLCQINRADSFCRMTIEGKTPLVFPDLSLDPRTAANPYVTGEPHVRFYAGAPLITPDGFALGALSVMDLAPRDFSEEKSNILAGLAAVAMDQMELRLRSSLDWLTGAASKGAFYSFARELLSPTPSARPFVALISFDLDHFKHVNDRHGHLIGDQVLTRVTQACRRTLRNHDVIARMGGEEFAVLLEGATPQVAMAVAERLRLSVAEITFDDLGVDLSVSASFGVAMASPVTFHIEDLMKMADRALYQAKANGRNRVQFADDDEKPGAQRTTAA
ncbi:sensor domain-containing diguanylate cyclase [Rhizobium sp. TRM95796]|uniref:sensor domain-containing diguanylate cyclase n=1 Tax=Rhizobium sp. TRM95796 TaxID=2979862 RepID=UPI0021E9172F|nr:sensor domain-containing diguanylate cyclase [Rhizobium sp. TRM95796]MCV3765028.1 sensor domain-containing diguanylate cyclase [Rhizobium sp. TRM95796]